MIRTLIGLVPAGQRRALWLHLLGMGVSVVLRALGAVLLVPVVSTLFGETPSEAWRWIGLLALVTLLGWVVDGFTARVGADVGFGVLGSAQQSVTAALGEIRLDWFDPRNTGTARQAVAATGPTLAGVMLYLVSPLFAGVTVPVLVALAVLPISWQFSLAALATLPLLFGAFWVAGLSTRTAANLSQEANSAVTERIVEFARRQQALRAARRVAGERSQAAAALETQHSSNLRLLAAQIPGQLLFPLATWGGLALMAGTAAHLVWSGQASIPAGVALLVVAVRVVEPFNALADLAGGLETAKVTLWNIAAVLGAGRVHSGEATRVSRTAPLVELHGVTLSRGETRIIDDLDLVFLPGSTTAVVGPSGAGKSTLLMLMAGLVQPDSGRVLVDGTPIDELTPAARQDLVSFVFQEPYLFDGTIEGNVTSGHGDASAEDVARAVALAKVDEIMARTEDGLQSRTGEGGRSLSGGERQRVSIARALVKPAPVLLVDEATSALDALSEIAIVAALSKDPIPRTRVVVAHKLGSIAAADRVLFMADGRVVEDGTVAELRARGGRFAEFWSRASDGASWKLGGGVSVR